jgi:hypothetical protein
MRIRIQLFISIRIQLFISIRIRIQGAKPMRIRFRLYSRKQMSFYMKKIYSKQVKGQKEYLRRCKSLYERQETRFICIFWSVSKLLWIRILDSQMNADPDPQHWKETLSAMHDQSPN